MVTTVKNHFTNIHHDIREATNKCSSTSGQATKRGEGRALVKEKDFFLKLRRPRARGGGGQG